MALASYGRPRFLAALRDLVYVRDDGGFVAPAHVDGTARVQTVDRREEPRLAALLDEFAARTGVPVLVNTSTTPQARAGARTREDAP